jgi:putative endonuclease
MPFPLWFYRLITFGRKSEILGIDYLRSHGYRVVASGYRTPVGEIDIIAWDGDVLVFVEVKARRSADRPEDAVGLQKQRRVIRAANDYLMRHKLELKPYRFDILAVTVQKNAQPTYRLLRDAFSAPD